MSKLLKVATLLPFRTKIVSLNLKLTHHVLLNVADEVSDPGFDKAEPLDLVLGLGRRDDDEKVLELVEDVAVAEQRLPSVEGVKMYFSRLK